MDTLRSFLRLLVGLQLFFIALYLDGHWGQERKVVHVIPAFLYVFAFLLYFAYMLRQYMRGKPESQSPGPEPHTATQKNPGNKTLRAAERVLRPILYTAVAVEFIVYWPRDWGTGWPEADFSWWLLAAQAAFPDLLVTLALAGKSTKTVTTFFDSQAGAYAQVPMLPQGNKLHLW
jgi:hypothetical protein